MAERIIIPDLKPDQNAALQRIFQRYEDRIAALERGNGHAGVIERDYSAKAGEFLNIEAPSAGLTITLPKSTQQLRNARVVMAFRTENPVRIVAALGLVNREAFVVNTAIGTFEAICDGIGGWSVLTGVTSSGSPTDARYVLGAAHGSLPNAAVGTDSAEVDFSFTPGGIATWVLNVASVAFSKLADLAGLSVLGRASNTTGVMAAITSTAARQVLRNNDAGNSLTWGFPIEAQLDDVDQGDVHTINREDGRLSVAGGIATFEKPQGIIVNPFAAITHDAYVLPATLKHDDILSLIGAGSAVLNGIDATGVPVGFRFILQWSDAGTGDGRSLTVNDEAASIATNRISLASDLSLIITTGMGFIVTRTATRWGLVDASILRVQDDGVLQAPARTLNALSTTSNAAVATVAAGVASLSYQRAALTGAVAAPANSNVTLFSGIRDNGAAENDRTNLNFVSSTSETAVVTDDAGNDELEITFQSAAKTGAISASANSNATLFSGIRDNGSAENDRTNLNFLSGDSLTLAITDDSGNDELEIRADYTGTTSTITNSTATGNLGTIDISTLLCGGTYRVSAASSNFSIEGFTAKAAGFWFVFSFDEVGGSDSCTLFDEDATATATNRLELPQEADISGARTLFGIFYYTGSRWKWLGADPRRIGTPTNGVIVSAGAVISIVTTATDIDIVAGGGGDVTVRTDDAAGGNVRLDSDLVVVTSGDEAAGGFIGVAENPGFTPNLAAGMGGYWCRDDSPCEPGWTDDTNADHRFMLFRDVVSEVEITSATGNLGTIDISSLKCGGTVNLSSSTGNWEIEGFSSKPEGFWFMFVSNNANTGTIRNEDATATATDRIRLSSGDLAGVLNDYNGIGPQFMAYYMQSRWRITLMGNL